MSKYEETIESMKNEIDYQIHFHECWDDTLFLTLEEIDEFLGDIEKVLNDKKLPSYRKLQRIVDMITNE